jgi:hypothetical protein
MKPTKHKVASDASDDLFLTARPKNIKNNRKMR